MRAMPLFSSVFLLALSASIASAGATEPVLPKIVDSSTPAALQSFGTASEGSAKAVVESYWLYGAPGSGEGDFEAGNGLPSWDGWTSHDYTQQENYWQVSDLNAATLGGHGAGNRAVWCGQTAAQQPGYVTGPGYGNSWNQQLVWESPPLVDPSIAQDVELEFFFHHATEPGYDFFWVAYDSAANDTNYFNSGSSRRLLMLDGTDFDWGAGSYPAPGQLYSDHALRAIRYGGNDYGLPGENVIRLRLHVTSDGAFSDQDGRWPTMMGALWVDDIRVRWDDGSGVIQESFEDFEGTDPLINGAWRWRPAAFAGDFASVLPGVGDLDPCTENRTPVANFIDRGQDINNAELVEHLPGTFASTGGSVSALWDYGLSGGYVVNYTGGVSGNVIPLDNAIVSPAIAWDLPGTADDGPDMVGARLEFDIFEHNPVSEGIFWYWEVRSRSTGDSWSGWENRNFVYFSNDPAWSRRNVEVSDLLVENPEEVQVSLRIRDLADYFGFPGMDATPAPYFDNVAFRKVRVAGPRIRAARDELANDAFPSSGLLDATTLAARDELDVRFDMVTDIAENSSLGAVVPGDSVVVEVESLIAGVQVVDIRMLWVLDRNPLFDDVRTLPARPGLDFSVDANHGVNQWSGEVAASQVFDRYGWRLPDRWFFDLPDQDFLYPGDVLRYAIRATDGDGRSSTLPFDISGLDDGVNFDPEHVVRGLPSIADASGSQPPMLVVDRTLYREEHEVLVTALNEMGLAEGQEYDLFHSKVPGEGHGNSIGAADGHGASTAQLDGYTTILFHVGDVWAPMGNGSGSRDKSDDIVRLTEWHALDGDRTMLHLGDALVDNLVFDPVSQTYVQNVMGVTVLSAGYDFRDRALAGENLRLFGEVAPFTASVDQGILTGCMPLESGTYEVLQDLSRSVRWRQWEAPRDIAPLAGAYRSHGIVSASSGVLTTAGVVIHDRTEANGRKMDFTVHVPLSQLVEPLAKAPVYRSAATELLYDLLSSAGAVLPPIVVDVPAAGRNDLEIAPNPFNPSTRISLRLATSGHASVRVFDLRGRAVRTLHRGELAAGVDHVLDWDGRDAHGESLASGVYFVAVEAPDFSRRQKVALIK